MVRSCKSREPWTSPTRPLEQPDRRRQDELLDPFDDTTTREIVGSWSSFKLLLLDDKKRLLSQLFSLLLLSAQLIGWGTAAAKEKLSFPAVVQDI